MDRNEPIKPRIRELKANHPFWGYRRIWAHLKYVDGLVVNKKRVLRLLREMDLLVKRDRILRAKRTSTRPKPRPTEPNQWWGIDMTKVMVEEFGWVYIVLVVDWYSKKVIGHYAGLQCKTSHWMSALEMAVQRQFPGGVRGHGVHLMSDNGSQPTSVRFMRDCRTLGITQAFTSYNNPKGNADTERMMRTLKEELIWIREWTSPFILAKALDCWIEEFNETYLHSTLGYMPPASFEKKYFSSHRSQLVGA